MKVSHNKTMESINALEWLNTAHHNTAISTKEIDLVKDAWQTSREITFDEIAELLENRAVNKPSEVTRAFSDAAKLVRALKSVEAS